ncbi:cyclic nucleotide-gated ion channel 18-like [Phragmites australis]|uniref:cyclic nucleotide-gated ion channel 18-like n=1 Tax=Phragmites australis TaxID=29695 RepID=UPI002D787368|nr:cyclic nucleotide-gated ion channel 18-like [Phragmites australis]
MAAFIHRHILPPFRRPPLPFFHPGAARGPSSALPAGRRPWTPRRILDPGDDVVLRWYRLFLVTCLVGLFVDPMYFYLLHTDGLQSCVSMDMGIGVLVTAVRTVADLFYLAHMILKFRIAFVAPSSRIFGRGELVRDPDQIAIRYLKNDFIIDLAAMLPIPQVIIWFVIPAVSTSSANHTNNTLSMIVLIQYIPRVFLIISLNSKIVKTSGVVTRTAWAGAAYNLLLYTLASHVLGALWYLLSIERQYTCWMEVCTKENGTAGDIPRCFMSYLDCKSKENPIRQTWHNHSEIRKQCLLPDAIYEYGLFADALNLDSSGVAFIDKYLYCLWWGFRNLSSYGQNLQNSTYKGETIFCILICIMGLVFFSHLIGNMQTYLQSMTVRLEEWRVKRRDIEEWMRHRQLPPELQERVRRFFQYKWLATRGVDEESILQSLPLDLRREIQRHLCLALVRRVPFFSQMDEQLLDAICERLVSSLSTKDAYIVREGDPVSEMLFIIRGELESSTTDGGRTNFFSSITLRPGDFCGEELLTWALMPNPSLNFPQSTRTVRSLTEVEAFALRAEDLKYVANQFKRLHSKRLQHAFRYYSHQWRSWGACFVQGAWRRYKKRKLAKELMKQEGIYYQDAGTGGGDDDGYGPGLGGGDNDVDGDGAPLLGEYKGQHGAGAAAAEGADGGGGAHLGVTFLASKFAKNTKRGAAQHQKMITHQRIDDVSTMKFPKLAKPDEPDFSLHTDDVL